MKSIIAKEKAALKAKYIDPLMPTPEQVAVRMTKKRWRFYYFMKQSLPFLFFVLFYLITFTILEHIDRLHYTVIHVGLDDMIPFVPAFIVPYLMWFPFMIFNVVAIYIKDRQEYEKLAKTLVFGMSIMLIVSILFPNIQYLRPEKMPYDNIFTRLCSGLYKTDTPTNICPSIHVYNTLAVLIAVVRSRKGPYKKFAVRAGMCTLGILICLSTMLVKQHSVFDVVCAIGAIVIAHSYYYIYEPAKRSAKEVAGRRQKAYSE